MDFNPDIHTKEFLLANTEIAFNLANYDPAFAEHPLAQDLDILSICQRDKLTVAHELATRSVVWARSEAAQNINVLTLCKTDGTSVAHFLAAYQLDWANTAAAQSLEVLSIAQRNGYTVAHRLALKQGWLETEAAKRIDVLKLAKLNGVSVVHQIAENNPLHIINSPNFKKLMVLEDNAGCSVAQYMIISGKNINAVDTLLRMIAVGAAYKGINDIQVANNVDFSVKSLNAFVKQAKELIDDEPNILMKTKLAVATYSTLINLNAKFGENRNVCMDLIEKTKLKFEKELKLTVITNSHLFDDMAVWQDSNCEPAIELITKFVAEKNLKNIPNIGIDDEQKPTMLLY
jgi:hypothetical protein